MKARSKISTSVITGLMSILSRVPASEYWRIAAIVSALDPNQDNPELHNKELRDLQLRMGNSLEPVVEKLVRTLT